MSASDHTCERCGAKTSGNVYATGPPSLLDWWIVQDQQYLGVDRDGSYLCVPCEKLVHHRIEPWSAT